LKAGKNVIYTSRLTSQMGKSYFSKIRQMPFYKHVAIRNWNTLTKLFELTSAKNKIKKTFIQTIHKHETFIN